MLFNRKAFGFVTKVANTQLKAYYVANIESNCLKCADALFEIDGWVPVMPEWLVPLCAAIAGLAIFISLVAKFAAFAWKAMQKFWGILTRRK